VALIPEWNSARGVRLINIDILGKVWGHEDEICHRVDPAASGILWPASDDMGRFTQLHVPHY
jgi:hypothetical protein